MQWGPEMTVGRAGMSLSCARATEPPMVTHSQGATTLWGSEKSPFHQPPFCTAKAGVLRKGSDVLLDEGFASF